MLKDVTDPLVIVRCRLTEIVEAFEERLGIGVLNDELPGGNVNAGRQLGGPGFVWVSHTDFDLRSGPVALQLYKLASEFCFTGALVRHVR